MPTRRLSLRLAVALFAAALLAPATGQASPPAVAPVVLNEINCEGTDWIELANTSASPVDVSGWLLTDDPLDRNPLRADHRYLVPASTTTTISVQVGYAGTAATTILSELIKITR